MRRSDVDVAVDALGDYQFSTTLNPSNVSVADEGAYTCIGENAGGSSTQNRHRLSDQ
jgi:hypothetical protein